MELKPSIITATNLKNNHDDSSRSQVLLTLQELTEEVVTLKRKVCVRLLGKRRCNMRQLITFVKGKRKDGENGTHGERYDHAERKLRVYISTIQDLRK